MSLSKQFKTNKTAETEGVKFEYPTESGVSSFTVARASRSNTRYTKALERHSKPHRRAIELKTLSSELAEQITRHAFIDGCLLRWEGVLVADVTGDPRDEGFASFSFANADALFRNLPDLFDDLNAKANEMSHFRDAEMEADAKN